MTSTQGRLHILHKNIWLGCEITQLISRAANARASQAEAFIMPKKVCRIRENGMFLDTCFENSIHQKLSLRQYLHRRLCSTQCCCCRLQQSEKFLLKLRYQNHQQSAQHTSLPSQSIYYAKKVCRIRENGMFLDTCFENSVHQKYSLRQYLHRRLCSTLCRCCRLNNLKSFYWNWVTQLISRVPNTLAYQAKAFIMPKKVCRIRKNRTFLDTCFENSIHQKLSLRQYLHRRLCTTKSRSCRLQQSEKFLLKSHFEMV